MKKAPLLIICLLLMTGAFAQKVKTAWPQMEKFHSLMSATFHPAEEGNLVPLKQKADSLYAAAKAWQSSAVPEDFKAAKTKAALKELVMQCQHISMAVKQKMADDHLKKIITSAHDTFHKISGECRKED